MKEIFSRESFTLKNIVSAFIAVLMLVMTFYACKGSIWVIERTISCVGFTVLSIMVFRIPKMSNKVSVLLLIFYLCYVPMKMFQRMELPMQLRQMSAMVDEAALLTVAFIIGIYLLIFIFTQNTALALGLGSSFFLILFLVEYYIWKFRGDFLMPSDLQAAGTAVTVMKHYNYGLSRDAVYSVVYFLFFIILGFKIKIRMNKKVHIGCSVLAALFIGSWYYTVMIAENPLGRDFTIPYWMIKESRSVYGYSLSFFLMLKDSQFDIPKGYSKEALETIAGSAMNEYETVREPGRIPDIIMIMNESWSDMRVLGELDTTEEYMPFIDSLTDETNVLRGELYVSVYGGNTANTEFEALTGNSLTFLSPAVIPYQNQVRHDMPSLARVLKNQGYETMAVHPNKKGAWSRGKVYEHLGFDDFISIDEWEVPREFFRNLVTDECDYRELIYRYENRNREAPFFLFNVTIQNHGGYDEEIPLNIDIVNAGGISFENTEELQDVKTYLNLVKMSDDAFKELIAYFEQVDEPVIICMFGDHQPALRENFYDVMFEGSALSEQELNQQKYVVPYVIWANYEIDWKEYGDMSANYLPAVLTECAGLQLPPFYQYLMELHEEYPVLTYSGCQDKNGNLVNITDIQNEELIYQYGMLQYNQLYDKNYIHEIFE